MNTCSRGRGKGEKGREKEREGGEREGERGRKREERWMERERERLTWVTSVALSFASSLPSLPSTPDTRPQTFLPHTAKPDRSEC